MNRNYNSPFQRQDPLRDVNQFFGYGNPYNMQSYTNQQRQSSSADYGPTHFRNSFQQQLENGNLQTIFRQWFNTNLQEPLTAAPGTHASNNNEPNNSERNNTSHNADSSDFENMHLKIELLKQYESLEFRAKLELRLNLPVMRQKNAILQSIQDHQVVLIVGDNGYGKSSQVPQMILDDYVLDCRGTKCRIICAQLKKMSALTLAERVACERNESLGKSVGFQVRRESCFPRPNASVLYCTTGILLKELRKDPLIRNITVCILDDLHEQNLETNQIMGLLKLLLPHRSDLKIILLSNNVVDDTFCEYFRNYHVFYLQQVASVVDLTSDEISGEDVSSDDIATVDLTYAPLVTGRKEKTKEQKAKGAYNKARAFIKKHRQTDPSLLTEQQRQAFLRHQQTIENFVQTNPPKAKHRENTAAQNCTSSNNATTEQTLWENTTETLNYDCIPSTSVGGVPIKRTISMDEPFHGAKRSRYGDSLDDDTEELQIAVVDLSDSKGKISDDKWLLVEAKLIYDMASEKWSKDQISFDSVNWHKGIKVISCRNKRSLDFLKTAIAEVEQMWPNARLKVVPRSTIPTYSYATVWIPPPIPPMEKILHLIKKQNVGLNTENWSIVPSPNSKNNFGTQFRLVIDGKSIKHIRESQCKIKFGLGSIRIRLHGY